MSMHCGVIGLRHHLGRRDRARCTSMRDCGVANDPGESPRHALPEPAPRPVFDFSAALSRSRHRRSNQYHRITTTREHEDP